ncbi:tRNA (cytosine(38)-C(5))-methyltransferase [Labeo rohita]|uniref:tRNA (cytosine(38)-C(5))-methyltransferase n=1 Tax=Labeo rohita TaxID=84645 RepID=A0ABQ8LDS8_LABRO|nr:tRNA (cytosine(38)-C(5))-methyltransferase [Labeo rohita]KAI2648864.1 tRNA (cytosine(38)-C(5))-methyltransferase [Labeo rohita]
MENMERLRVLELYSGIGGMHYALKESSVPAEVVAAVDVNTTANDIYKHNFPNTPLLPKTIEGMTLQDFDKLNFDVILMSPPCQPFTRIGLQGDVADPRTKSFLYILDLLPRLSKRPRFILLENVKGFETSAARDALLQTLRECDYSFQEFLISPTSLGIPNSRLRYFLIAKRPPGSFSFLTSAEIMEGFPMSGSPDNLAAPHNHPTSSESEIEKTGTIIFKLETEQELERKRIQDSQETVRRLQDFLQEGEEDMDQYLLPPKTLLRYALLMDVVQPSSRRSVCFTKGYGHYVEGTGSVLQSCVDVELESVFKNLELLSEEDKLKQLHQLKLRYFTPREIANLMGFPADFTFPKHISIKQQYRVLGNSLNVHVVSHLIRLMISN